MNETKKKMSNRTFRAIMIPIAVVLFVLILAFTIAGNVFGGVLDTFLGRGERHVVVPENTENWDTEYYDQRYTDAEASKANSLAVNVEINDEGMILLKNNGVLPLDEKSKVTPFGKGYVYPYYNAPDKGGSIKMSDNSTSVTPAQALAPYFNVNSCAADLQPQTISNLQTFPEYPDKPEPLEGASYTSNITSGFGASNYIPELAVSAYDALTDEQEESMADSVGLVFITRMGNEDSDKRMQGYDDGTRHYLDLSKNEMDMIKYAKSKCSKVVLVLAACNPLELNDVATGEYEVDAILWAGNPGENGFESMAKILCGKVNPSGRLYDIYSSDFTKDASYNAFGAFEYLNDGLATSFWGRRSNAAYVEYLEGMYNGYRYYETACDMDSDFVYGELDGKGAIKTPGAVVYPFGYGLSYTTFEQKIESFSTVGDDITIGVRVTNKGSVAGKEVVQIYYNAPYTDLDRTMKIEKPTVNLVEFAKTGVIDPGKNELVTITFSKEDMTSYCYTHDNGDGTKGCYMMEEGDYEISLRANSHDVIDTRVWSNPETIWYGPDNPRRLEKDMQAAMDEDGNLLDFPEKALSGDKDAEFIAATNIFDYMNEYMEEETTMFSRSDWDNTFPGADTPRSKTIDTKWEEMCLYDTRFDPETDSLLGNVSGSEVYASEAPVSGADNGLSVLDMRGRPYFDENWAPLLDQIDWDADKDNINQILCGSNYFTNPVDSIGLPPSEHGEGANGVRVDQGPLATDKKNETLTVSFCMCPNMAATWNVELMEKFGDAMGQEALVVGKQARYSPAMNLHRSPFTGRVIEYFSEDPVLTGKIATGIVNGTSNAGLIDYIKHFGMNDQETNRTKVYTWANEQVQRELYNKAFEMVIRDARKTIKYTSDANGTVDYRVMRGCSGMMVSQSRYGAVRAFMNYDLVTRLVREEWNFRGVINGDMYGGGGSDFDLLVRSGADCWLAWSSIGSMQDYDSATSRNVMREAIHHVAFAIANSSVLQNAPPGSIIYYDISPWRVGLIVANVVVYVIIAGIIVWIVLRAISERRHPEAYRNKKRDG